MELLRAKGLKKNFGSVHALRGVDLELGQHDQYVIRGPSGSGKSTLLYLIGGLDRPTEGEIWVEDYNLGELDDESLAQYRNHFVGFVFQFHFLLPSMTCEDNIYLPGRIAGADLTPIGKEVQVLAKELGVSHCLSKYPFQLSGGEQQRINIIRALSLRPKLLLCDEPTGSLDSKNSNIVIKILKELSHEFSATLIVVTHNEKLAMEFPNRIFIEDGKSTSSF